VHSHVNRCGSGTFAIEAALLAMRRAPGLQAMGYFDNNNDDGFTNGYSPQPPQNEGGWAPAVQRWPDFDYPLWKRECAAAAAVALPAPPCAIAVSDWHAGALGLAHSDAQRAGVVQHIQVRAVCCTIYIYIYIYICIQSIALLIL
jgi:23S rRNA G2445 N2-methylase RlmL